jgi:hypothetical protein
MEQGITEEYITGLNNVYEDMYINNVYPELMPNN